MTYELSFAGMCFFEDFLLGVLYSVVEPGYSKLDNVPQDKTRHGLKGLCILRKEVTGTLSSVKIETYGLDSIEMCFFKAKYGLFTFKKPNFCQYNISM